MDPGGRSGVLEHFLLNWAFTTMRILIVASNISARMGGEAVLPWHYIRELTARGHEVHAATHARVRSELLEAPFSTQATFHFVEDSFWEKFFHRLGQIAPAPLRDPVFNTLVAFVTLMRLGGKTRALAATHKFDIIHQPTPVSPLFPSFTYGVAPPVIIGPMNGGMSFPPAFRKAYSKGSDALVNVGRLFGGIANKLIPGKRKATRILVSNPRTEQALPSSISKARVTTLAENGVDLDLWTPERSARPDKPVFAFVGRLILLKGADMLIEAFGGTPADAKLIIIGDGPERERLEQLAQKYAPGRVEFAGFQPQEKIRDRLAQSTALILPTLRDCGGAVILEAFACGAPAIATDWGGPQDYITPENGFLIEPRSRDYVVEELAGAMNALAADTGLASRLGASARSHVEAHFSWAAKADKMLAIYRNAVEDGAKD